MAKKEFTNQLAKELNNESDVELIERLAADSHEDSHVNTINAILDKRNKQVTQYLTEIVQKSNKITEKQNKIMIWLTIVVILLTGVLVWLAFKIN